MPHPALALLDTSANTEIDRTVRRLFNHYTTATASIPRAIPTAGVHNPTFVYPDDTLATDLCIFLGLIGALFEVIRRHADEPAHTCQALVDSDPRLQHELWRMFQEGGEFWFSPGKDPQHLTSASCTEALTTCVYDIWRTLRNGAAHVHWLYGNSSDQQYWLDQGWSVQGSGQFNLGSRPSAYFGYIADALPPWNAKDFWRQKDLRILGAPFATLRYSLHLFLNIILNDTRTDVFGNNKAGAPCLSW